MEYRVLGKSGVKVSRVGFGTGSSGFSGSNQQTRLTVHELSDLLLYAHDRGINFWDTGYTYGTHPHISEALKHVERDKIVISTKFSDSFEGSLERKLGETLRGFKTDYIDICLLHGARNSFEIKMRAAALKALIRAKRKGHIRAIGLSAHGIGAIESAMENDDIDIIFARINWSGAAMDAYQENFLSKVVAVPYVKEAARKVIPKTLVPSFSAQVESIQSATKDQEIVRGLLKKCSRIKPVVGMKIFGAGQLTKEIDRSVGFIMSQSYVNAFLLGMNSREEVDENLEAVKKYSSYNVVTA